MKRILFHFSFWIPALLFLIHQISQKLMGLHFQLVDFYLDPFCFAALAIPLYTCERTILFDQHKLTTLEIILLTAALITFSEVILPYYSNSFVFDYWDILMITFGAIWFALLAPSQTNRDSIKLA